MQFLKAMATVGGWTMASRILGFVRDILIARYLGTGPIADAWVVAFRFPNLFRRVLGEGAFNAAFVPLFARRLEEEGHESARRFAEEALAFLLAVTLVLTLVAMACMPWIMVVMAPGFLDDPAQFAQATQMAQIAFPYILFMSLVALYSGLLNSLRHFAASAAAPVLLNVALILALAIFVPLTGQPGYVLVWGVAFAGGAQFLMMVIAARRAGYPLRLRLPRLTPAVRRLCVLMLPGIASAGALQINIFVSTLIATLEEGAASLLYYADRVYQLPLGLIGIAISVVLLPEITRRLRGEGEEAAQASLSQALDFALFLTLPATVALIVVPLPIAIVLFQGGAFGPDSSQATAWALTAFAVGLPGYVVIKVLQPAFFAREDMVTPLRASLFGMVLNTLVGAAVFFLLKPQGLGYLGLAGATSLASFASTAYLVLALKRRGLFRLEAGLRRRLPRQLLAALIMGAALFAAMQALESWIVGEEILRIVALLLLVFGGLAAYLLAALLVGTLPMDQIGAMRQRLRERRSRKRAPEGSE